MEPTFRASMNWLHTWAGVVLGGALFAIFWTGTLSVFDREIDRWMAPTTRLDGSRPTASLETLRPYYDVAVAAGSPTWFVALPTEREPFFRINWRGPSGAVTRLADPATAAPLPDPGTSAGTRFLYPFHYMLHIRFADAGYWLVGFASMAMLVLCISGVVVHRRLFADFFTMRIAVKPSRLVLDLHTVTGVIGFPFHVVITLSGLIIFYSIYFPSGWQAAYPNRATFQNDVFDNHGRPKVERPGRLASLDDMAATAARLWRGEGSRTVFIRHPGDEAAYVQIERPFDNAVARRNEAAFFDAGTGALLRHRVDLPPVKAAQRVIMGVHLVHFRHWTLRWLYFALGLLGCVLIASGYLFWLGSRRKKHARLGIRGVPIVDGLTIGSVTGILIATVAFFVVNRLLPLGITFAGYDRAGLEVWTFYLVWIATFVHAWARPGRAWIEQCQAIAVLAMIAVALNWLTTGDHLVRSLGYRRLWSVAGMDLLLLAGAASAAMAATGLHTRSRASRVR